MRYLGICLFAACASLLWSRGAVAAEPPPSANNVLLVLPFAVSDNSSNAWIGKAVQRDLEADLMRGTRTRLLAPSSVPPASDSTDALEAARRLGASIVVFGQMQSNATEVRLTGQVIDVATEKPLGPMKATGLMSDLFHLEDAIAGQALSLLPKELLNGEALNAANNQPASPAPPAQTPTPQTTVTNLGPTTSYEPPATTYTSSQDSTYTPPPTESSYQYASAGTDVYPGYVAAPAYSYSYGYACPFPAYTYPVYPYPCFGWGFPFCGYAPFGVVIGFDHHHDDFHDHHDSGHGFDHADHGHGSDHGSVNHSFANHGGGSNFVAGGHGSATPGVGSHSVNGGSFAGPNVNRSYASPAARSGFAPAAVHSAPHASTFSGGGFRGGAFHGSFGRGPQGGSFHGGSFHASSGGFHGGSGGAHAGGGRR